MSESKVEHVSSMEFEKVVLGSDVPVLVDFYADWCGPCQRIAPLLEEIAETTAVRVVKVDIDKSRDLADRYNISSIPALRLFEGGELTQAHNGLLNRSQLEAFVGG